MKEEIGSIGALTIGVLLVFVWVPVLSACTVSSTLEPTRSAAVPVSSMPPTVQRTSIESPTKPPASATTDKMPSATFTLQPSASPEPSATLWRPKLPKEDCQPTATRKCTVLFVLPEQHYASNAARLPMQFRNVGYHVVVASRSPDVVNICTSNWDPTNPKPIAVDLTLADVKVTDYDALVFIGGFGCQDQWDDEAAHRIARDAVEQGVILGAIGCAPTILAHAGVLEGRTVAICEQDAYVKKGINYCQILENFGAICSDELLVRDGLIVSAAPGSHFLTAAIIEMINSQ